MPATALLLLACQGADYSLIDPSLVQEPVATYDTNPDTRIAIDVAFQESTWGETLGRCQVQVSFSIEGEATRPPGDDEPVEPVQVDGCTYKDVPEEEGEPGGDIGTGTDDWQLQGSLDAGPEVLLVGRERTLTLIKNDLDPTRMRYEWQGCNEQDFPFGEVFDLEVPGSPGALEPFSVTEAFGVGLAIRLDAPTPVREEAAPVAFHEQGVPLEARWTPLGDPARVRGEDLVVRGSVTLRNTWADSGQTFQHLFCPAAEVPAATVSAGALALLAANTTPSRDEAIYDVNFQVDVQTESAQFEVPWGATAKVVSVVSQSGPLHLYTP